MPHLSPMNWLFISMSFWMIIFLFMSLMWWSQSPIFTSSKKISNSFTQLPWN